jgi:hypothetical protein
MDTVAMGFAETSFCQVTNSSDVEVVITIFASLALSKSFH